LPRGDFDGDGELGLADFDNLADCLSDPEGRPAPAASGVTPAHCLSAFDRDFDGDIDLVDFAGFQAGMSE
jgi:hypothetical protein